jgi:hypothetical protein
VETVIHSVPVDCGSKAVLACLGLIERNLFSLRLALRLRIQSEGLIVSGQQLSAELLRSHEIIVLDILTRRSLDFL